ncbi:MAG TPA: peptidylprolyl isomerase [Anaerolineaceae bacterium]|nr:peptidylprolyl isomerase [Anaerolineaceae bacterium]
MAKENTENKPKPSTKKHEARLAREKRQRRLVTGIVGGVLIVVIILVAYGILYNEVFKKNQAVAKVGNTKITVEQFVKRVQYERLSYVESFTQYAASGYASLFQSYLLEMQNTLDNYIQFGSDVLDKMIDEAVISAKAKELGITVSEEEIEKELERGFGFFPNGTPTPTATVEVVYLPTSTLSPQQLAIVTITPTPSPEPTETPEPTATTGPTEIVTETPVTDLTATATMEPTATEILPTATPYTREGFQSLYKTMLSNISSQFPYTEADFREYVTALLLNQKMYDYVTKDIPRDQEMVWARHILVATEEEAQTVLNRLNAGEDFAAVAAEVSTDTSNSASGGDLGWFTRGQMVPAFEDAAFSLEIGKLSDPIKTDYGYHIIQVLGREVRTLTDEQLDTVKSYYFRKFIDDAKAEMTIKKYDIWAENVPSTPAIPEQYRITNQQ